MENNILLQQINSAVEQLRWVELQGIFQEKIQKPPENWFIPEKVSRAILGSRCPDANQSCMAFAFTHIAIGLADDILDNDLDGLHHHYGTGAVVNMSQALLALSFECLTSVHAVKNLSKRLEGVCVGQMLDSMGASTEDEYWNIAYAKSANFFAIPFELGGVLANCKQNQMQICSKLGELYGLLVQVGDDIDDCLRPVFTPDWTYPIRSLPILFANVVNYPCRDKFVYLQKNLTETSLQDAQDLLIGSGAVSYCIWKMEHLVLQAHELITQSDFRDKDTLFELFGHFSKPISSLRNLVASQRN
ncbi:MAG TPA: polyprenyl synthetase family protein [Anaerolineales bacterium]|nr:polyprenyl synthetase family protein [Anaerolineales bacterium]